MKYYNGNELKWSTEDIKRTAEYLDMEITEEEAESILIDTFRGNDALIEYINETISDTINDKNRPS